ncbi:hypothetical protein CROQUDRAFT_717800 [Cronartium quercuum f. sp. fusiforme G11]|uniref:Uncharacterized protein n=1 Tax=Cronartium quercuum f. sp. fusiforme G11 TaxID=708437 RepID=A0A9P6T861_9BASI|nr:hypothetical protein CROQUDRAFT_717800 [Cronartium quercuum f. sp. fusiforme G11]
MASYQKTNNPTTKPLRSIRLPTKLARLSVKKPVASNSDKIESVEDKSMLTRDDKLISSPQFGTSTQSPITLGDDLFKESPAFIPEKYWPEEEQFIISKLPPSPSLDDLVCETAVIKSFWSDTEDMYDQPLLTSQTVTFKDILGKVEHSPLIEEPLPDDEIYPEHHSILFEI